METQSHPGGTHQDSGLTYRKGAGGGGGRVDEDEWVCAKVTFPA